MSNIDYLIPEVQLAIGDIGGTAYSEATYRRALLAGVRMLSKRWSGKYYVDGENIARSTDVVFENETPLVEVNDEYAIILAAVVTLRQVALTSSASSFENWSTPDLSYSAGGKERALTKLYSDALQMLEDFFRGRLGRSQKKFMYTVNRTYPILDPNQIDLS